MDYDEMFAAVEAATRPDGGAAVKLLLEGADDLMIALAGLRQAARTIGALAEQEGVHEDLLAEELAKEPGAGDALDRAVLIIVQAVARAQVAIGDCPCHECKRDSAQWN